MSAPGELCQARLTGWRPRGNPRTHWSLSHLPFDEMRKWLFKPRSSPENYSLFILKMMVWGSVPPNHDEKAIHCSLSMCHATSLSKFCDGRERELLLHDNTPSIQKALFVTSWTLVLKENNKNQSIKGWIYCVPYLVNLQLGVPATNEWFRYAGQVWKCPLSHICLRNIWRAPRNSWNLWLGI